MVSSLPFSVEALADVEKKQNTDKSLSIVDNDLSVVKRKVLTENNRKVINETRGFVSDTQQALIALEKNDTKAALAILQNVSKKLTVILDKNPVLASVTTEMETDILDFEGNVNAVQKKSRQADELLDDGKEQIS
ncbi:MAG: YfdX family protein [Gammaproteobacteria bacterium]